MDSNKHSAKEVLDLVSEAISFAEGALRTVNIRSGRPQFINKRSQPYGSGQTYPRNTSRDRHKNQVMYRDHVEEIQMVTNAIPILEEILMMLNTAKSDLNNKTNTSNTWNHLEKIITYDKNKSYLDRNVDTFYFKNKIKQVLDFLDQNYPMG